MLMRQSIAFYALTTMLVCCCWSAWAQDPLRMTIFQPATQAEPCGAFDFSVNFSLTTTDSGWIIQKVTWASFPMDCELNNVPPVNHRFLEYWEGWRVDEGDVFIGFTQKPHIVDRFSTVSEGAGTLGMCGALARVAFIKDYPMDETQWQVGAIPEAGELPTRTSTPAGWSEPDNDPNHALYVLWGCCGEGQTARAETLPKPQKARRAVGMEGDLPRNTVSVLESVMSRCPSWVRTDYKNMANKGAVVPLLAELRRVPINSLRSEVAEFQNKHRFDLDAMGKLYVLNRVLFNVPQRLRVGSVPFFGGWAGVPVQGGFVNAMWPLSLAADGTLLLTGKLRGYGGEPYDALGEFDHFLRRFGVRP